MRRFAALTLFVFSSGVGVLAGAADSGETWKHLHGRALAAADRKDFETAVGLLQQCRAQATSAVQSGVSMNDLGMILFRSGKAAEAKPWLRQAIGIWRKYPGGFDRLAQSSVTLAELERQIGEYDEAERVLRDALAQAPSGVLSESARNAQARALDDLADMMREEGRSAESRKLFTQLAALKGVVWRRAADAAAGLAELDSDAHNWEESAAEWNRVGEIARDHDDAALEAAATRGLGQLWLERNNPDRAEPLLKRALAAFESDPKANELEIAATQTSLGILYLSDNKPAMAEEVLTAALQSDERSYGEAHPQVAVVLQLIGDALARRNEMDLARDDLSRSVRILSASFGERSVEVASALASWGAIEQRSHNPEQAADRYEKALTILRDRHSPEPRNLQLFVMQRYADVLKATHHKEQASALLAEVKSFEAQR